MTKAGTPEHRRKCKEYNVRRLQMGGSTLVPAEPSAAILSELNERMSLSAIGNALGTSHTYVAKLIRGEVARIAPAKAAAIANLANYRPTDTSHVAPEPGMRRLRALHALGYTWARLSREIPEYALGSIKSLARGEPPFIEAQHDQAIRTAYDRLSMALPEARDHYEQSAITHARNSALRKGWAPPLAYNDIDDPTERPHLVEKWDETLVDHAIVERVLSGEKKPRRLTNAEASEITRRAFARGQSTSEIEKLYGLKAERYFYKNGDAA